MRPQTFESSREHSIKLRLINQRVTSIALRLHSQSNTPLLTREHLNSQQTPMPPSFDWQNRRMTSCHVHDGLSIHLPIVHDEVRQGKMHRRNMKKERKKEGRWKRKCCSMLLLPCTENWLLNSKTLFQMSNVAIDFNRCNTRPQTFRVTACVHDSCDLSLVNSTAASATTLEFRDFLHTSDNNKLHSMAFLTFESIRSIGEHSKAFDTTCTIALRLHSQRNTPLDDRTPGIEINKKTMTPSFGWQNWRMTRCHVHDG